LLCKCLDGIKFGLKFPDFEIFLLELTLRLGKLIFQLDCLSFQLLSFWALSLQTGLCLKFYLVNVALILQENLDLTISIRKCLFELHIFKSKLVNFKVDFSEHSFILLLKILLVDDRFPTLCCVEISSFRHFISRLHNHWVRLKVSLWVSNEGTK
jgi:hypothetical protein